MTERVTQLALSSRLIERQRGWCADWSGPDFIAFIAVVLSPVALAADYRANLGLITDTISFRPLVENGGRPVTYEQLFGWTQVLWLVAGAAALTTTRGRDAFRRVPVIALVAFAALLGAVTTAQGGIDHFAMIAIGSTVLPLIAMMIALLHPRLQRHVLVIAIAVLAAEVAALIVLTLGKAAAHRHLSDRLGTFLFGSPTYSSSALAVLIFVVVAARLAKRLMIGTIVVIAIALGLAQTRGSIVAVAAGLAVIAALRPGRRRLAIAVCGALALVLVVGIGRPLSDASNSIRQHDISHHLHLFTQRPLVGYGISSGHANAFRAADNTLVGILDATGIIGLALWVLAWTAPLYAGLRRGNVGNVDAWAVAAVTATFASWVTTGNEVLIYAAPTNLLPSVLALALIYARPTPRPDQFGPAKPMVPQSIPRPVAPFAVLSALAGAALAVLIMIGAGRYHPGLRPLTEAQERARVSSAAAAVAFSSCGPCNTILTKRVSPGLWLVRLSPPRLRPSPCFEVLVNDYATRPPDQLPPGIAWVACPHR